MTNINVKIIHPTNNSDIDLGLPENIVLGDVFSQLIDANFLSVEGQPYVGVLKSLGGVRLDNEKNISENGVRNNDTIQILAPYDTQEKVIVITESENPIEYICINCFIPGGKNYSIRVSSDLVLRDLIRQLVIGKFLEPHINYEVCLGMPSSNDICFTVDNEKTLEENGIKNNDTISFLKKKQEECVKICFCHPTNGKRVSVLCTKHTQLKDILVHLISANFLDSLKYAMVYYRELLNINKTVTENGIESDRVIDILTIK